MYTREPFFLLSSYALYNEIKTKKLLGNNNAVEVR